MIRYDDEHDLQRKIAVYLNKQGFHFDVIPQGFDLKDTVDKVYVEVKPDSSAPAQILYAIARGSIEKVKYIGLATAFEIRIYKSPSTELINEFARSIDPSLNRSPSSVTKREWNDRASELLGECHIINDYKGTISLQQSKREIFIDDENLGWSKDLFEKYGINPVKFLTYIADVYGRNQRIVVNSDGKILNINTGKFFANVTGKKKVTLTVQLVNVDDVYSNYKPIRDKRDKEIIESLRVQYNDIKGILHQFDRFESIKNRRARGRFFTKDVINNEIKEIVESIDPDYIIEPYIGAGSLIESIIGEYPGIGNDINSDYIQMLRKKHEGRDWTFVNVNMFTTTTRDLLAIFKIPTDADILFLTNPPFGTSMTNSFQSKKGDELSDEKKSRKVKIDYGDLGDAYGRGDMVLPAISRMIEIIKLHGKGYIATFAPVGVYCGRDRYNKLFKALLADFEFISGDIFSGKHFNSVSKNKPIAFVVWRYSPGIGSSIADMEFMSDDKTILLRKTMLLRDGWRYRDGSKYVRSTTDDALWVFRSSYFNEPYPHLIGLGIQEGFGAEIAPENVKIELNVPGVPSELVYALWSVVVGTRSLSVHPIYIDNAYVHLPDFTRRESVEILALAVISTILTELRANYCKERIGFIGAGRVFRFGNPTLTNGAMTILSTHGNVLIGDKRISDIVNTLRTISLSNEENLSIARQIKKEIQERLNILGYWDHIPISNDLGSTTDDE